MVNRIPRKEIIEQAIKIFYKKYPEYEIKYGERGKTKAYQDWSYHLSYLHNAISVNEPNLFLDYVTWCIMFFKHKKFSEIYLKESFQILQTIFSKRNSDYDEIAVDYLSLALKLFEKSSFMKFDSFIHIEAKLGVLAQQYLQSLLRMDRQNASKLIFQGIDQGISIRDIYLHVFQPSQYEVGRLWQMSNISVGMEHFCTAATQSIISQLYPHLFTGIKSNNKLIATSVTGELHELGIRMVTDFFEMDGWDTYFLGASTPNRSIIDMMHEIQPQIIAISATIAFNVDNVKILIQKIRNEVTNYPYKILVGGYPFNKNKTLWEKVGADGQAMTAQSAIELANQLLQAG